MTSTKATSKTRRASFRSSRRSTPASVEKLARSSRNLTNTPANLKLSSAAQNGVQHGKTLSTATDLASSFGRINPANAVFHVELTRTEEPDIWMVDDIDMLGLPLRRKQVEEIQQAAREGDYNVRDADASHMGKDVACVYGPGNFTFENPAWDKYIDELVLTTAKGLGLTLGEGGIRAQLNAMWLWTKDCGWCDPLEQCAGNRRTWVARMLIMLPSKHQGGDINQISIGYEAVKSYSTSRFRQSLFSWHKDMNDLRFEPPSEGHRLGLLYDLHVAQGTHPSLSQMRTTYRESVQGLQNAIERWALHVKKGEIERVPYFLPLPSADGALVPRERLTPSDRTILEVFDDETMGYIRGFRVHAALAVVQKREFFSDPLYPENNVEYTIEEIADIKAGDALDELPVVVSTGEKIDWEDSILNVSCFHHGLTKDVIDSSKHDGYSYHKTMLCLMIFLEEE